MRVALFWGPTSSGSGRPRNRGSVFSRKIQHRIVQSPNPISLSLAVYCRQRKKERKREKDKKPELGFFFVFCEGGIIGAKWKRWQRRENPITARILNQSSIPHLTPTKNPKIANANPENLKLDCILLRSLCNLYICSFI